MKILCTLTIGLLLSLAGNLHGMWALGVLGDIYKHCFTQKTTFNDLPPEIIQHIASFLPNTHNPCNGDTKNLRFVNKLCAHSIEKPVTCGICKLCKAMADRLERDLALYHEKGVYPGNLVIYNPQ